MEAVPEASSQFQPATGKFRIRLLIQRESQRLSTARFCEAVRQEKLRCRKLRRIQTARHQWLRDCLTVTCANGTAKPQLARVALAAMPFTIMRTAWVPIPQES